MSTSTFSQLNNTEEAHGGMITALHGAGSALLSGGMNSSSFTLTGFLYIDTLPVSWPLFWYTGIDRFIRAWDVRDVAVAIDETARGLEDVCIDSGSNEISPGKDIGGGAVAAGSKARSIGETTRRQGGKGKSRGKSNGKSKSRQFASTPGHREVWGSQGVDVVKVWELDHSEKINTIVGSRIGSSMEMLCRPFFVADVTNNVSVYVMPT